MKLVSKTKVLFVVIAVLILAGVFLLQRPDSDKSSDSKDLFLSNQETNRAASNVSPVHDQESELVLEKPAENTPPLKTIVPPTLKSSPPVDMEIPALDDIVAPEEIVWSNMISNFYTNMGLKIEPLTNPPKTVVLKRKPKVGEKLIYQQIVIACDENGEPVSSNRGVGLQNKIIGRIVKVDPNQETYVVEWQNEPSFGVTRNAEVRQFGDPHGKTWKEKVSFAGKVISQSGAKKAPFKSVNLEDYPQFEYPSGALTKGQSWTSVSANNKENFLAVEAKGFAIVNGKPCIVLQVNMHVKTTMDMVIHNKVSRSIQLETNSKGLRYVDYETGVSVAEDVITLTNSNGSVQTYRSVKQIINPETHETHEQS